MSRLSATIGISVLLHCFATGGRPANIAVQDVLRPRRARLRASFTDTVSGSEGPGGLGVIVRASVGTRRDCRAEKWGKANRDFNSNPHTRRKYHEIPTPGQTPRYFMRSADDLTRAYANGFAPPKPDDLFEAGDQRAPAGSMEVLYAIDEIRRATPRPGEMPN